MKLLMLLTLLGLLSGCTTSSPKQAIAPSSSEKETYFSVEPHRKTKMITYHVQTEKLSPILQSEFEKALTSLSGKCWVWASPSYKETLSANGPEYCVKFVKFKTMDLLKPFKPDATDKKMLLTALDSEDHIQVQNFVWDGTKLQRVRNSDSHLRDSSFQDFMMLWALK